MKLTKTDLTELHQRATWAASKGYTIARADEYLAALCKQNGMKFFGESATADAISQLTGAMLVEEMPAEDLGGAEEEPTKVEEVAEPDMSTSEEAPPPPPAADEEEPKTEEAASEESTEASPEEEAKTEEAPPPADEEKKVVVEEEKAPAKPAATKGGSKPSKKG